MAIPRAVGRWNKAGLNRVTRHIAPWLPGFGVVVHRGRRSGRRYRTPVNVFATADGYRFALTYGPDTDWVRNVLAAGGLVTVGAYPVVDYVTGDWIGGLEAATRSLLDATDESTRIVPAFGSVCGRAELDAQLGLCAAVRERVADAYRKGLSFDEFVGFDLSTTPGYELHGNPMYGGAFVPFAMGELNSVQVGNAQGAVDEFERIITARRTWTPGVGEGASRAENKDYQRCLGLGIAYTDAA